jgi:hypothetical protein
MHRALTGTRVRLLAVGVLMAAGASSAAPQVAGGLTAQDVGDFLGGLTGKYVFVDASDSRAYVLDLGDLSVTQIANTSGARSPLISPGGTHITYWTGAGAAYVVEIASGTKTTIKTGGAYDPHWFREGSTDHIVYVTSNAKDSSTGQTMKQRLKADNTPDGAPEVLWTSRAMDSGLSPDGKWLGEAYGYSFAVDLDASPAKEYDWSWYVGSDGKELQTCNGSMSPDSGSGWRMLTLMIPHDFIRIWKWDAAKGRWPIHRTFEKPSGKQEWQHPEWSNHPDYFAATAGLYAGTYEAYLVDSDVATNSAGGILKVLSSDTDCPCLWVEGSAPYLACKPGGLVFQAMEGDATALQETVAISNWGTGSSLGTVAVKNQASLPSWLDASLSGSGNSYTLTVAADPTGVSAQAAAYEFALELTGSSSSNATDASPRILRVEFYVLSATADQDGDGVTNADEVADGSDPLDPYHPGAPAPPPPTDSDGGGCSPDGGCGIPAAWLVMAGLAALVRVAGSRRSVRAKVDRRRGSLIGC